MFVSFLFLLAGRSVPWIGRWTRSWRRGWTCSWHGRRGSWCSCPCRRCGIYTSCRVGVLRVLRVLRVSIAGIKSRADGYPVRVGCYRYRVGHIQQTHAVQPVGSISGNKTLCEKGKERIGSSRVRRILSLGELHIKLDTRRPNREKVPAISGGAGSPWRCCGRLIDTPAIGVGLVEIGLIIVEDHGIACRHECDGRGLVCSCLEFVERQRRQHVAWVCQVGGHPGRASQRAIQSHRQQTVIAAIDLCLRIL